MFKLKLTLSKVLSYDRIALALTIAVTLVTYIRLYFSVDFTDEAYYVARAYQYALGAKLWADDISLLPFAILTVSFVRLYHFLIGNTDGIILFTRHLYFAFSCLIFIVVFLYVKTLVKWSTALLISSTCISFIPFNIPNLSYNTLGIGFFTAGCFWGVLIVSKRMRLLYLLFSGFCHSLAILSYPTLLIPSVIYLVLLLTVLRTKSKQLLGILAYCVGGLPIIFLLINLILDAGIDNVLISRDYAKSLGYSTNLNKFYEITKYLIISYVYILPFIFILTIFYICFRRKRKIGVVSYAFTLIPLIPIPITYLYYDLECGCRFSIGYLFYYSLIAPCFLLLLYQDRELWKTFYIIWIPSFISGIVIAYTSANGYPAMGLGMLGANIVTTIFLLKTLSKLTINITEVICKREIISPCLVIILLVLSQYYLPKINDINYRDSAIYELNTKIEDGPFKGLYTTHKKQEYLAEMYRDLKRVYRPGDRVIFYGSNFPAGYLLTSMRSATKTFFLFPPENYKSERIRQVIENYISKNISEYRVIAVKVKRVLLWDFERTENTGDDFINHAIEESPKYKIILNKQNYSISIIDRNE